MTTSPRRLTICADDYGLAPGVNRAIRDLLEAGRINATSVMVLPESFDEAAAVSLRAIRDRKAHIGIGLHVTLTAPFHAMSAGWPAPGGAFVPVRDLLAAANRRVLDPAALTAEVEAQLARFTEAFGGPPDFIDGHQHVHLFPQIRDVVLAVSRHSAPRAWVRQCGRAGSWIRRLSDRKGLVLDILSVGFRRRARRLGVRTNRAFAGTYNFSKDADFAALFPRFLDSLPDGGLVMCHPGFVDGELKRLDPLTGLREREYAYFMTDGFPRLLAEKNIVLA
ncbi:MAG: ChbG/HpnK family deacetylase [Pseudolabrys sp.]